MVIPAQRVGRCSQILAAHFREISIYRLTAPDSERYQQTAVFGIRRTRQEKDRLKDTEVSRERGRLWELTSKYEDLPMLGSQAERTYTVPAGHHRSSNGGLGPSAHHSERGTGQDRTHKANPGATDVSRRECDRYEQNSDDLSAGLANTHSPERRQRRPKEQSTEKQLLGHRA